MDKTFLDWPFFEPHHRLLGEKIDEWATYILPALEADAHHDIDVGCRHILSALAQANICDYSVIGEAGGAFDKLDVRSLCIIRETLAQHSGLADFVFAMQGLGSGAISLFGTREQKLAYLPAVREGRKIAAFALTEPASGSDVAHLESKADQTNDGYILKGEKTFISNGGIADFYTVFARTGGADGARGISAFIVDADNPNIEIVNRIDTIAPHPLAHIKFNGCVLPKNALLGSGGDGFKIAMATLDVFRSTVGAAALGFAKRALAEASKRAEDRHLFGGKLSDLQLTQAALGEMALNNDASALLIYRAAWKKDTSSARITKEAAMAKLFATEQAQKTIDAAVQLFGGQGVVSGEMVEKLYREIRALRIYEGASEVQKMVIAREHLKETQ